MKIPIVFYLLVLPSAFSLVPGCESDDRARFEYQRHGFMGNAYAKLDHREQETFSSQQLNALLGKPDLAISWSEWENLARDRKIARELESEKVRFRLNRGELGSPTTMPEDIAWGVEVWLYDWNKPLVIIEWMFGGLLPEVSKERFSYMYAIRDGRVICQDVVHWE